MHLGHEIVTPLGSVCQDPFIGLAAEGQKEVQQREMGASVSQICILM